MHSLQVSQCGIVRDPLKLTYSESHQILRFSDVFYINSSDICSALTQRVSKHSESAATNQRPEHRLVYALPIFTFEHSRAFSDGNVLSSCRPLVHICPFSHDQVFVLRSGGLSASLKRNNFTWDIKSCLNERLQGWHAACVNVISSCPQGLYA